MASKMPETFFPWRHAQWTQSALLQDGTAVIIRPLRPDDASRLQAFFAQLSVKSFFSRFMSYPENLPGDLAARLATVGHQTGLAMVVTRQQDNQEFIIAEARYDIYAPPHFDIAEAGIVVEDDYQGNGLGSLLLGYLVAHARVNGVRAFVSSLYAYNPGIMRLLKKQGLPVESKIEQGVWELKVALDAQESETTLEATIARIENSYFKILDLYRNVPLTILMMPALPNGRSVKDTLAQLAAWQWRCVSLLRAAHHTNNLPGALPEAEGLDCEIYQERRNWRWQEVEIDFRRAHQALLEAIWELPRERLNNDLVQQTIARGTWECCAKHLPHLENWYQQYVDNSFLVPY